MVQAVKDRGSLAPMRDGRGREKDVVVPARGPLDVGTQESGQ